MMNGINYITDEQGRNKAILLDLIQFKKDGASAESIFEALSDLQGLIDAAGGVNKTENTWEKAKEKLKCLNK